MSSPQTDDQQDAENHSHQLAHADLQCGEQERQVEAESEHQTHDHGIENHRPHGGYQGEFGLTHGHIAGHVAAQGSQQGG